MTALVYLLSAHLTAIINHIQSQVALRVTICVAFLISWFSLEWLSADADIKAEKFEFSHHFLLACFDIR